MSTLNNSHFNRIAGITEEIAETDCKKYRRHLYKDCSYLVRKSLSFTYEKSIFQSTNNSDSSYKLPCLEVIRQVTTAINAQSAISKNSSEKNSMKHHNFEPIRWLFKRPHSLDNKNFGLSTHSNSTSSKLFTINKIQNKGINRQLWIDALHRAEMHEIKQESLVSDIFSLSNLDVTSFKQRSIILREASKPSAKEQLNDPYFSDHPEVNPEKEEFNNVFNIKDVSDIKKRDQVESMILNIASESHSPLLKEIVNLNMITTSHYMVYFNNRVTSIIFEYCGSAVMQFLLFRFSQEALTLLYNEVFLFINSKFCLGQLETY